MVDWASEGSHCGTQVDSMKQLVMAMQSGKLQGQFGTGMILIMNEWSNEMIRKISKNGLRMKDRFAYKMSSIQN